MVIQSDAFRFQCDSFPLSKVKMLPNGAMHWIAPIARSTSANEKGLPYLDKAGKLYFQQVDSNLLRKTIDTFKGVPTTLGHPQESEGITPQNATKYMRGMTSTGNVTPQTDTHIWMCGTNLDAELIEAITNKQARQISPGYGVKVAQTDQEDVVRQTDRLGNHIAFLPLGRNGKTVALNLDDGSQIQWDFYQQEIQMDADYLALLQREVLDLPEEFLSFDYVQKDAVDLTPHVQKQVVPAHGISMKTFQIVGNNGQVLTFQADSDDVSSYIGGLRSDLETKTIALANKTEVQVDGSQQAEIDRLLAELATAKEQKPEVQNDAAVNEAAIRVATGLLKVLPKVLEVNPEFNVDAMPVLSESELKRQYMIAVNPTKKDKLEKLDLNLDSSIAYIEGVYEATVDLRANNVQQDAAPVVPDFMSQFRSAVKGAIPQNVQTDAEELQAAKRKAQKELTDAIDSNF